jgi:hypothetical protein
VSILAGPKTLAVLINLRLIDTYMVFIGCEGIHNRAGKRVLLLGTGPFWRGEKERRREGKERRGSTVQNWISKKVRNDQFKAVDA